MNAFDCIGIVEAAKRLSISRRTLERCIAEGRLSRVKFRGRTLIAIKDLERFVRRQTETAR